MENSGSHRRANSSSFDSDSDFNGKYLKLFEQQTKNSKLNPSIANINLQKKNINILPQNITDIDNQAVYQYGGDYTQRRHNSGAISKQLEKMREEHMRIMRIMDEESKNPSYKPEFIEYQGNNNITQKKSPSSNSFESKDKYQRQFGQTDKYQIQVDSGKSLPFQNNLSLNSNNNKLRVKEVQSKIINQSLEDFGMTSVIQQKHQNPNRYPIEPFPNKEQQKQILTPATILEDISEQPRSGIKSDNYFFNYNNEDHEQQHKNQYLSQNPLNKIQYERKGSIEQARKHMNDDGISMLSSIEKIQAAFQKRKIDQYGQNTRPQSGYIKNQKTDNVTLIEVTQPLEIQQRVVSKKYAEPKSIQVLAAPQIFVQPKQQLIKKQLTVKQQQNNLPLISDQIKTQPHIKLNAQTYTGKLQAPIQQRVFKQPSISHSIPQQIPQQISQQIVPPQQVVNSFTRALSPPRRISQSPSNQIVHVMANSNQNRRTTPIGLPHHGQRVLSPAHNIYPRQLSPRQIISQPLGSPRHLSPERMVRNDYYPTSPTKMASTDANFFNNTSSTGFNRVMNTTSSINPLLNTPRSVSPAQRLLSPKRILQHHTSPVATSMPTTISQSLKQNPITRSFENNLILPQSIKQIGQVASRPISPRTISNSRPVSNYQIHNQIIRPPSIPSMSKPPLISSQRPTSNLKSENKIKQTPILSLPQQSPSKPKMPQSFEFGPISNGPRSQYPHIHKGKNPNPPISQSKRAQKGISVSINRKK